MALQITPDQVVEAVSSIGLGEASVSQLKTEYLSLQVLLNLQPPAIQRFIKSQASKLAEAFLRRQAQIRFDLPDTILVITNSVGDTDLVSIPTAYRRHTIGGLVERLVHDDVRLRLDQYLTELELAHEIGLVNAVRLIRFSTADYLIYQMLPTGRDLVYTAPDKDDIPNIPLETKDQIASAITAANDAIVIEDAKSGGRGELQVPYAPAARRFYLPQWVPFDQDMHLLVGSIKEAESCLTSMQNYLEILQAAVTFAPYMVANSLFQHKRSGMLGQLVNQGRIYASYITNQIIQRIKQRAASQELNRGLSLSLPYFDEQALQIRLYHFVIIPAGRIMFVSAFVVLAARLEQVKVAQDTHLSPSTRKHLLAELERLEKAFS